MMKKMLALMIIAALALSCTAAFAATYIDRDRDLTFDYDETQFEITMEDETDDELLVILGGTVEAWGQVGIRFHLADLDDGETFPTPDDFTEMEASMGIEVDQGEWNGFRDVFMYNYTADEVSEYVFIAPVYDDDREIEDILTINVTITDIEDEGTAMSRDDAISAVLNTMQVLED